MIEIQKVLLLLQEDYGHAWQFLIYMITVPNLYTWQLLIYMTKKDMSCITKSSCRI